MQMNVEQWIDFLKQRGSSLILNWGEDNDCWEVDWITSGKRYRGVSKLLTTALSDAYSARVVEVTVNA